MKRRTKTTTETHEVWVVRRAQEPAGERPPDWCGGCGGPARMLAPDEAAALAGVSPRTIYRWVEAGRVHFAETPDGRLSVCLASLPRAARE